MFRDVMLNECGHFDVRGVLADGDGKLLKNLLEEKRSMISQAKRKHEEETASNSTQQASLNPLAIPMDIDEGKESSVVVETTEEAPTEPSPSLPIASPITYNEYTPEKHHSPDGPFPSHILQCSPSIHREFCVGHVSKNFGKHAKEGVAEWTKENTKSNRLKGVSKVAIVKYCVKAFHSILDRFPTTEGRKVQLRFFWDHISRKSKHKNPFCENWTCVNEAKEVDENEKHVRVPRKMARFLKEKMSKFFEEGFLDRLQLTANNNRIESLNKSFTGILSKDSYHKREEAYNAVGFMVAVMANHGKEFGFGEALVEIGLDRFVTDELRTLWRKSDEIKTKRRKSLRSPGYKQRQLDLKRGRKAEDVRVRDRAKPQYKTGGPGHVEDVAIIEEDCDWSDCDSVSLGAFVHRENDTSANEEHQALSSGRRRSEERDGGDGYNGDQIGSSQKQ